MPDVRGLYARYGIRLPALTDGWASVRCFSGRHRDRNPSARIHLRSGGFRCFSCSAGGGVLDALELLGVDRDEARRLAVDYGILDPPKRSRRPAQPTSGAVAELPKVDSPAVAAGHGELVDYDQLSTGPAALRDRTWVYVDRVGTPVGRVRRLDLADGSKRIWQERPVGDSWAAGLDGIRLPLYQLPLILTAAREGMRVLVVEGEKAVDALDRIGFLATCNSGGAGKWRPEHTRALAGANVVAIADSDLAGRLHAIDVTEQLDAAGVTVLAPWDPFPVRRDGSDVVDYLAELAATERAVVDGIGVRDLRERLRDHLRAQLARQGPADPGSLQHSRERARFLDDPADRAELDCQACGDNRVHRVSHGLAFCPCGAYREAPA
jgi:hypothetical protein